MTMNLKITRLRNGANGDHVFQIETDGGVTTITGSPAMAARDLFLFVTGQAVEYARTAVEPAA